MLDSNQLPFDFKSIRFAVSILKLVVDTGIEPVTYTMSTWCSTPELIDYNLVEAEGIEPF